MFKIKKLFVMIIGISFIWSWFGLAHANPTKDSEFEWVLGEELTYKVKWAFVNLGKLKLQVYDTLIIDNRKVYHTKLFIDSNPMLFFVNMHSVFDSYIDENFNPHLFIGDEKIDGVTYKTRYHFNHTDKIIDITMTDLKDTSNTIRKQIPLEEKLQDGMSLIFYTRGHIQQTGEQWLKALYEAQIGKLFLRTLGRDKKTKIDALDYELDTYKVDGKAYFKSIAGFKGDFEGWFAAGSNSPPLYAKLKVFIGNVSVELESWKNWQPIMLQASNSK